MNRVWRIAAAWPARSRIWRFFAAPLVMLSLAAVLPAHHHGAVHDEEDGGGLTVTSFDTGGPGVDHQHGDDGCAICHLAHFLAVIPLDAALAVAPAPATIQCAPAVDVVLARAGLTPYSERGPPVG